MTGWSCVQISVVWIFRHPVLVLCDFHVLRTEDLGTFTFSIT